MGDTVDSSDSRSVSGGGCSSGGVDCSSELCEVEVPRRGERPKRRRNVIGCLVELRRGEKTCNRRDLEEDEDEEGEGVGAEWMMSRGEKGCGLVIAKVMLGKNRNRYDGMKQGYDTDVAE